MILCGGNEDGLLESRLVMQEPVDGPLVSVHPAEAVGLEIVRLEKRLPAT